MAGHVSPEILEISLILVNGDIGNIELLRRILSGQGIDDHLIVEILEWPYKTLSVYFSNTEKSWDILKVLRALKLKNVKLVGKVLKKKDWALKWKDNFKPFILTRTFGIVPMWQKGTYTFRGKVPIYIDSDLAFGTGLHPTTKYMARIIERTRGRFKSFLDVGSGTGILSIIAAKCGAKIIDAVDICPEAVKVARGNFMENACPQVNIRVADAYHLRLHKT